MNSPLMDLCDNIETLQADGRMPALLQELIDTRDRILQQHIAVLDVVDNMEREQRDPTEPEMRQWINRIRGALR